MNFVFWYSECNVSTRSLESCACNSRPNWLDLQGCIAPSWGKTWNEVCHVSRLLMSFNVCVDRSWWTSLELCRSSPSKDTPKTVHLLFGGFHQLIADLALYLILVLLNHLISSLLHQNKPVKPASRGTFSVNCCKDKWDPWAAWSASRSKIQKCPEL